MKRAKAWESTKKLERSAKGSESTKEGERARAGESTKHLERNGDAPFEAVARLDKDLKLAAKTLGKATARFLVDRYYQIQDRRIRDEGQIRSSADIPSTDEETGKPVRLTKAVIAKYEPHHLLLWMFNNDRFLEHDILKALDVFTSEYRVGIWLKSICGIGPVIAAGLFAHLDITRAPTAGHFWRFAGLDPTNKWEKKTKRPWNADLKVLVAFKAGESFVKTQNNKEEHYGKIFVARKALEQERNAKGLFADQARKALEEKHIGKDTVAFKWYSGAYSGIDKDGEGIVAAKVVSSASGNAPGEVKRFIKGQGIHMLPPAHIHARARRYASKLFLAHVHQAMFMDWHGQDPPRPYIFEFGEGDHRHLLAPPNWPMQNEGKSIREMGD